MPCKLEIWIYYRQFTQTRGRSFQKFTCKSVKSFPGWPTRTKLSTQFCETVTLHTNSVVGEPYPVDGGVLAQAGNGLFQKAFLTGLTGHAQIMAQCMNV